MRMRPPMTRQDVDDYRDSLLSLAARLDRNLARDRREVLRREELDVPGGPFPAAEDVLDGGLLEVETGVIANESHVLAEVTAALRRIDAGTFGWCETCGRPVSRRRLDSLPYARTCIRCARVAQPAGR
jgi:DnaK suppressor protein